MPFRSFHVPGRIATGSLAAEPDSGVRGFVIVSWASLNMPRLW